MPDTSGKVTEQEKADLSKRRGQAAATIADPEEKKKFIAEQGTKEADKGDLSVSAYTGLSTGAALKGYKNGTDSVPKTGPAILHKGEAVLKKSDAEHYRKVLGLSKLSGKDAEERPSKKVKEVRIRKGSEGGYIVENHHENPMEHPMTEHPYEDQDAMLDHVMEHMGEPNDGEEEGAGA